MNTHMSALSVSFKPRKWDLNVLQVVHDTLMRDTVISAAELTSEDCQVWDIYAPGPDRMDKYNQDFDERVHVASSRSSA